MKQSPSNRITTNAIQRDMEFINSVSLNSLGGVR